MQYNNNFSYLLVLVFEQMLHFLIYGAICLSRTLLVLVLEFPEDKSTHIKSPCNLKLGSIQQVQLLAAKLSSKQAILVN